jgi:hypothetical protein
MMKLKTTVIFIVLSFAACGEYKGTPVDSAQICNAANHKQMVETQGFLTVGGSVLCSDKSGKSVCGLTLKQNPNDEKGIAANVEAGSGANTMDRLESGSKDLKIRDNAGALVTANDKVKVTAEVFAQPNSLNPKETVCFLTVRKIEK